MVYPRNTLPSGTVTFLFTDIEGSTKRWEAHPQAMQAALQQHDSILRGAIEGQGGYIFKTMGDAFCAAFAAPTDALRAAIAAQSALHHEGWPPEISQIRVRMALHTGVAELQSNDYFGQPLNRVARLLSAGHGGQVLLSVGTYELVRDNLPQQASLQDMGEHRLRDLIRPEHIYQLVAPDLPSQFPPLKTLDYRPNNLPAQPTALIGRAKELPDIDAMIKRDNVRLLTLTGPGGTGKTRLALQAAADLLDDFQEGVWFVNLAPIMESNLVIPTVAQVLGVKEVGSEPLIDTLKTHLKQKHTLLLLDNFEQVVSSATQVSELLTACPQLKVLVTSRIALRLRGEREYAVSPLALPDPRHLPPLEVLTQYDAVRPFIERASEVKADFEVNNDNAPAVAEICVRLDGLPLAVELAAARIRILPPEAMLSRLQSRLKLLTGGARDLPARQQTLRNTIEWSYDLLDEEEKRLFRRMSVFQGGCSLDAAEAVCTGDGDLEIDVMEGVESLVAKSLVTQEEVNGEPRFVMLETIHEYAREKLGESGESETLKRWHAEYFTRFSAKMDDTYEHSHHAIWRARVAMEFDNLRAAMQWANEHEGESLKALAIVAAMERVWAARGQLAEGMKLFEELLSAPGARSTSRLRARILRTAGFYAMRRGDFTAAKPLLRESYEMHSELNDLLNLSRGLGDMAILAANEGDIASAREFYKQSLAKALGLGHPGRISAAYNNLGEFERMLGNYADAQGYYEQALNFAPPHHEDGDVTECNIAATEIRLGDYERAQVRLRKSLLQYSAENNTQDAVVALLGVAGLAAATGSASDAVKLLASLETYYKRTGNVPEKADQIEYDWYLLTAREQLTNEELYGAQEEGSAMSIEQAISYALEGVGDAC